MSYQLKVRETFSDGIKRIVAEELGGALDGLQSGLAAGDGSAVHETRKRFKKLRAVLRLVRGDLGKKGYREANILLRDAGRELSSLRDAQVLIETLEALAKRFPHGAYRPTFEEVCKALRSRQQLAQTYEKVSVDEVLARVAIFGEKVADWHIGDSWDSVVPNLDQVYERGLESFKKAYRNPSDEGFHEWRKAVKNLWYHLRILHPLWTKVIKEFTAQASTLADLLGDEHDLAVLSHTLAAEPKAFGSAKEVKMMRELIETHREEIRAKAWLLGLRLYADKPKRFTKRFEVYWRGWREEREKLVKSKVATS